jgi:uncharacterized membrane protein
MAKKSPQQSKIQQAVAAATPPQPPQVQTQIQTVTQAFQGPIPPPDTLQRYDQIIPGAAERILTMAENETAHRHLQEDQAMQANIAAQQKQLDIAELQSKSVFRSDTIGQLLGFAVSLLSVGGAVYLALNGQPWVASALVGLPLAGVIRALREKAKPGQ